MDVTERKEAELLLRKYSEDLKLSNATKDKFFSIIAHDLRGPFAGFMGLSEDMVTNLDSLDKEVIGEYANAMYSTSKKLFELLTNLLEWSRLQTGKTEFHPRELNLFEEASGILTLFSSSTASKSIYVNNNIGKEIWMQADRYSITTILRNLISNAVKFTPVGGVISISAIKNENGTEITVADTGIGMDDGVLSKVFRVDSGYTTSGTNGEAGSGLGLVLCRELIKKNGGEMNVISTPGIGTVFTFMLPDSSSEDIKVSA